MVVTTPLFWAAKRDCQMSPFSWLNIKAWLATYFELPHPQLRNSATQNQGHSNFHIFHYCWKGCKIVIAHRKPKNAPHARTSQVSTKWVRTRRSQLATAHHNSQLAIAHHKSCLVKHTPLPKENHPISIPIFPMGVPDTLEQYHLCYKQIQTR